MGDNDILGILSHLRAMSSSATQINFLDILRQASLSGVPLFDMSTDSLNKHPARARSGCSMQ